MSQSNGDLASRPQAPLLVFDIETVPDIELLFDTHEPELDFEVRDSDRWKTLRVGEAALRKANQNFPPPMFHVVVSVCAVYVHPETYTIMDGFKRTLALPGSRAEFLAREKALLQEFWAFAVKHRDFSRTWYDALAADYRMSDFQRRKMKPVPVTFCGYNISGFDLPVLEQRSLRHLLTCPLAEYGRETGYDSYRSRYAVDKTFDLCQYVAGASSFRTGLNVLSRAIGLGGKMEGMDGSKVAQAYYDLHQWDAIEEYCAVDVLITYGVLLAVQKFRGTLPDEIFREAVEHFERFLRQEGRPASYRRLAETSDDFFSTARMFERSASLGAP
jgi:predicted PolB exonuclease-like 3'-5' exonuclease